MKKEFINANIFDFEKESEFEEAINISEGNDKLKTSDSLGFLKQENEKIENIFELDYWSLYLNGKPLQPLKFSNGKTQTEVVEEIVNDIKGGHRVIFLHGACGTGKCLDKDTRVFCKLDGEPYFSYNKISNLVGKKGITLSVNDRGTIVESQFKNVIPSGRKKLYLLKTRSGRRITASENHPFLTITREGVKWVSLDNLSEDSYVCLPNKYTLSKTLELDNLKIKILAHLIAEGKLGDKSGSPKYYQDGTTDFEVKEDYKGALKKVFPDGEIVERDDEVTIVFRNKDTSQGTTNKLRLFVREFGLDGKRSGDKFIPPIIFNLSEEKVALFLRTLFSGDGSIYCKKSRKLGEQFIIEYDSISKKLVSDISLLLSRFGIQHTMGAHKFRSNLEYSWRLTISSQEQVKEYIEKIGFIGNRQLLALKIIPKCKIHKFTNIDKVPRAIRDYLKDQGYSYNQLNRYLNYEGIEKLRKDMGFKKIIRSGLVETPDVFRQSKIDFLRCRIEKINDYIKDPMLSFICNPGIIWDKVKSINYIKEDETYDLEVPEHHNFIADGIIVHNSAIALNVARALGRASVVVPVKALQRQYEEDYTQKMSLLRKGKKMKIAMMTGRENHDSVIEPGKSCADPFLPENIKLVEKNYDKIIDYYHENPFTKNDDDPLLKDIRRSFIAPANPYWSPIVPASIELQVKDARKRKYQGCDGKDYIFYHRKKGCSYYDQYLAYFDADVVIFNSAKYLSELSLGRKPMTEVDIIDEADDFLDSLFQQSEVNLTRFASALKVIIPESAKGQNGKEKILELLELEEKNKRALGVDPDKVAHIKETKIKEIFEILNNNSELEAEIALEELNYSNKALEAARNFQGSLDEVYLTFRKEDDNLISSFVSTNLAGKFQELVDKTKALVFMSGTLHSESVLKNIFKIKDYKIVEAETLNSGSVEIIRTGKEFDCKYSNLKNRDNFRKRYVEALSACLDKSILPTLVHVHAYQDLPKEGEKMEFGITNLVSAERLMSLQNEDKTGLAISLFKQGLSECLFSTKCSRGVDFPGSICNSIVFTKYPNPNVGDPFWKVLQMKHPDYFWDFYRDKARREFQQRIFRAVRSVEDHVYILSPDTRVLDAVREMQTNNDKV